MGGFPYGTKDLREILFPIAPRDASGSGGAEIAALRKCNELQKFNIVYR
jgi:hypothetical protein